MLRAANVPPKAMQLRHLLKLLLLTLVGLTWSLNAHAASDDERAHVHVDVIVANDRSEHIDEALDSHRKALQEQFPQFTHFTLHHSADVSLRQGATERVTLPNGEYAALTLESAQGSKYRLQIKVPGGQTTLNARSGAMLFLGGLKAPNGTLILLIQIK